MLAMVGYIVLHGPWNNDACYSLLTESFKGQHAAKTCELSSHYSKDIRMDMGGGGVAVAGRAARR